MKFSERMGITPVKHIIQLNDMNNELRTGLWNVLMFCEFDKDNFRKGVRKRGIYYEARIVRFSKLLWANFFKKTIDSRPKSIDETFSHIRQYFFRCPWNEVYDFIEFFIEAYEGAYVAPLNEMLEREMSGYRIIEGQVAPITSPEEIQTIQDAIDDQTFPGASIHLKTALQFLSNKTDPEYRNSIKESISAVESACCVIVGSSDATLGAALNVLKNNQAMHGALLEGFKKLYGYTSDEDGIRHAMMEEPSLTQADAIYFLVSCSAFINYLKSKTIDLPN